MSSYPLSLPPQLSFVFAEFPMRFVLNRHLNANSHILHNVQTCGKHTFCAHTRVRLVVQWWTFSVASLISLN